MNYGLDIGGTKMELGCFDDQLNDLGRRRIPTPGSYESLLDAVATLVQDAQQQFGPGPVGIALPGLVDSEGRSLCANLPFATGKPLGQDLARRLGQAVTLGNDCRCFALSEAHGGAGQGQRRVFGAVLGTGAAGGLVVDGKLYQGRQGIAGEYGHQPAPAAALAHHGLPLWRCGCGQMGCFEAYVAGPGLVRLHRHFGGVASDAEAVLALWRQGDAVAQRTLDCHLDLLAACFTALVLAYDPDILVLGGGLSKVEEFYTLLPPRMNALLFGGFKAPPLVPARFGDASGARGIALLAAAHD
ncbi:ROK family protein [Gallaecimonas kandeliae]|uniref:ROK family protein n=1 Tax=Gallaecimonas kandeliae TaxID=3029055 RepID=UPI002649086B|nr:ROK family protein [Gallaecimonas kandeliae]WKE65887.1 ROK family protein [Gallaecimonas kandeliae]